jgi:hypothetical protein
MNTPNNLFATPKESENYNYRPTENSKSKWPYFCTKKAYGENYLNTSVYNFITI